MFEKKTKTYQVHTLKIKRIRQCPKKPFKGLWKAWKITALDYFKNEEKKSDSLETKHKEEETFAQYCRYGWISIDTSIGNPIGLRGATLLFQLRHLWTSEVSVNYQHKTVFSQLHVLVRVSDQIMEYQQLQSETVELDPATVENWWVHQC